MADGTGGAITVASVNGTVFAQRFDSDGALLGLTYIREQQMAAWHWHDTDGTVENVCVVPEGDMDALYLTVKRVINGTTKRYIERMESRQYDDSTSAIFMDSTLSYDGTNVAATTMTLTTASVWTAGTNLTLTASAGYFASTDVGKGIHITAADGSIVRCLITAYTGPTVVTVTANITIPADLRAAATAVWGLAITSLVNLFHLEDKEVSIFADGWIVASPDNDAYTVKTVASGAVTLPRPFVKINVGLPYIMDVASLNLDTVQGETLLNKKKLISKVNVLVDSTRALYGGEETPDGTDPLEDLDLVDEDTDDVTSDNPPELVTGAVGVQIKASWNLGGKVALRVVDPVPVTILGLAPEGFIGGQQR